MVATTYTSLPVIFVKGKTKSEHWKKIGNNIVVKSGEE